MVMMFVKIFVKVEEAFKEDTSLLILKIEEDIVLVLV